MLDASDSGDGGPSGFYEVADVDAFHAEHRDSVHWVQLPQDLPPIRFASFADPAGTLGHPAHRACRSPRTRAADPGSYSKVDPANGGLVKPTDRWRSLNGVGIRERIDPGGVVPPSQNPSTGHHSNPEVIRPDLVLLFLA